MRTDSGICSIPTRLIPHLFHTTSPSNLSLSSSSHSHHSALPLQIHLSLQLPLTPAKDLQTLLPSILLPILITKDIESLPKNSREYPSPELPRLPLVFLPILKKLPNSPKTTTDYSLSCHSEHKELHRLSLKRLRFPLIYPKISPSKWNNHPQISTFIQGNSYKIPINPLFQTQFWSLFYLLSLYFDQIPSKQPISYTLILQKTTKNTEKRQKIANFKQKTLKMRKNSSKT